MGFVTSTRQIGVIFDCDGTLLDSMEVWHGIDSMLARNAQVEFTRADQDYFTAASLQECGEYAHGKLGIGRSPQHVIDMIHEEMYRYYSQDATLKPGVRRFVEGLYEAGVPMSVASSTSADLLVAGMKLTGLDALMTAVLSTDHVGKPKRFPDVYNAARDAMGTPTATTWGVEDAIYAIRTLNGAGYRTLGIYDSDIAGSVDVLQAEADKVIMTFEDITAGEFLEFADEAMLKL